MYEVVVAVILSGVTGVYRFLVDRVSGDQGPPTHHGGQPPHRKVRHGYPREDHHAVPDEVRSIVSIDWRRPLWMVIGEERRGETH
jgi:hypothetical protein